MGIIALKFAVYCDGKGCHRTIAEYISAEEAEIAACRNGWRQVSAKRWFCAACVEKLIGPAAGEGA